MHMFQTSKPSKIFISNAHFLRKIWKVCATKKRERKKERIPRIVEGRKTPR